MLGYSFGFGLRARRITKQCYASKWKSHVLIESTKPQHLSDSCLHCIFEQGVKMLSMNAYDSIWLQSIALIAFGKAHFAANCFLISQHSLFRLNLLLSLFTVVSYCLYWPTHEAL